ncbi:hypothetical protein CDL15_Pgr006505 [Punica granatum]|uniref:Uncharacterized protein n=1 Tax=Punica granatum TaxID=22663 RepID=A0A218XYZ1_PUNGR|nr:hypothetical protein CDL15_Pgr006505 [Punica granatum]
MSNALSTSSPTASTPELGENHDDFAEEIDELRWSTKRVHENSLSKNHPKGRSSVGASYRDKLAGMLPGAFKQAFQIDHFVEDDSDDDVPPEDDDGQPRVLFTRKEKL